MAELNKAKEEIIANYDKRIQKTEGTLQAKLQKAKRRVVEIYYVSNIVCHQNKQQTS